MTSRAGVTTSALRAKIPRNEPGAAWHVRFDPARVSEPQLRARFTAAGATELSVEPAEATLEDVFLAVVARKPEPT